MASYKIQKIISQTKINKLYLDGSFHDNVGSSEFLKDSEKAVVI